MQDKNGVNYIVQPKANRAPPPTTGLSSCTSWYKGFYATFDVYGGGWADSDFGQANGGLQAQIRGCGVITGWAFEYYNLPTSDGTEWHASASFPSGRGDSWDAR